MRTFLTAFLITASIGVNGYSECVYFRTAASLQKCARIDAEKVKARDPYPDSSEDPELDESGAQTFVKVDCECAYSLKGSDVLCDPDQTMERSSVIGAENPAETCRRGRALCKDICPSRLP